MGNCGSKQPSKAAQISAEQQAKINETTAKTEQKLVKDLEKAEKEAKALEDAKQKKEGEEGQEKEDEKSAEEEKEAKDEAAALAEANKKVKKAKKRLSKLQTLKHAREVGALSENDYNAAIRRLQAVTGSDPTDALASHKYTLPEGMEWLTSTLEVMWPSVRAYTKQLLDDTIQPAINRAVLPYGISVEITKLDLGDRTPAFGPITSRFVAGADGVDGEEERGLEISLGVTYRSDIDIEISTTAGSVGVQCITFTGTLFFWIRPFLDDVPFIGACEVAFVNPPNIELDWTGFMGGALQMMGLQKIVRNTIDSTLANMCVVPNFMSFPLVTNHPAVDPAKLRCPKPEGVLRLTILGAENLGDLSADPLVQVKVGAQMWNTDRATPRDCPRWLNSTHDFLVYSKEQWVFIDVCDDQGEDDVLGSVVHVPVDRLVKRGKAVVPLTKNGLPVTDQHGVASTLSVRAQWLSVDAANKAEGQCLVSVQINEIKDLPEGLNAPYRLRARTAGDGAGTVSRMSKPGGAKPGSVVDSHEMLRLIRENSSKSAKEIAEMLELVRKGDEKLVEQALEREGAGWVLEKRGEELGDWWRAHQYVLDWQAYPSGTGRAAWNKVEEGGSEVVNDKAELKKRVEYFKRSAEVENWHHAMTLTQMNHRAAINPYYCCVLHLWAPHPESVTLELVGQKDDEVLGTVSIPIEDTHQGERPDVEGPFSLPYSPSGAVCSVFGDVTVRNLHLTKTLPPGWDPNATSLDAKGEYVEWWKDDAYVADWAEWMRNSPRGKGASRYKPVRKWMAVNYPKGERQQAPLEELQKREAFYTNAEDPEFGSGASEEKKKALEACLKAGALTWGDYDVILGKLLGEPEQTSIAETLEWLNFLIIAMWPGIREYTTKMVKNSVEPTICKLAQSYVSALTFKFTKVDLGKREPSLGTIQCRKLPGKGNTHEGVELVLNGVTFDSELDIMVEMSLGTTVTLGVKDFLFKGNMILTLKPMLPGMPIVGAVQFFMPNPPTIDLTLTGNLGGVLQMVQDKVPAIDTIFKNAIVNGIAASCVVPNYIVVPLSPAVDTTSLRYPEPIGVMRIEVREAMHLRAGDTDNSDAYVAIRVGSQMVQTKPVTSLNPQWTKEHDNTFDMVIYNEDQYVDIEVFDADTFGKADSLGAVYQKETVLGGGTDDIVRGIPVRAMRRLGTAVLPLYDKVKDKVSSHGERRAVYELKPVVGHDEVESRIILHCEWICKDVPSSAPLRTQGYLVSTRIDKFEGITGAEGPLTVQVTCGSETRKTTAGVPAPDSLHRKITAENLHSMVQRMDDEALNTSLGIPKGHPLLNAGRSLNVMQEKAVAEWHTKVVAAIDEHLRATAPHFNHVIHIPLPASRESQVLGDQWACPTTIAVLDKKGRVVVSKDYAVREGAPVNELRLGGTVKGTGGITVVSLKSKNDDPSLLTDEEEGMRMTPFKGPEFIDTPEGVRPKIGMYVLCRNLVKMTELNWRVPTRKPGQLVRPGDRAQPEGKVIGWTSDHSRAVVDFGGELGEWRVRPANLVNAPPPLPPPPPPKTLYVVAEEVFEAEGQYDLVEGRLCRDNPYWQRDAPGPNPDIWRIFTDEEGRWAIGPASMEGVSFLRSCEAHAGRFPHMMGHKPDPEVVLTDEEIAAAEAANKGPRYERLGVDMTQDFADQWIPDREIAVQIEKPIAREHEEVLDEMVEMVEDDILEDLQADIEADLAEDIEADLADDVNADVAEDIDLGFSEPEAHTAEDESAEQQRLDEEAERQRQEEEAERQREEEEAQRHREEEEAERQRAEEERQRQEEERRRQEEARKAEEEERRKEAQRKEEEERKRKEEEERKKKKAEDERKKKEEEERKKKEEEKKRKEEEARKKAEEEKRKKEEAERKAREEAERKRREEEERRRREEERRRQEELRRKKAEEERKRREAERKARKAAKRKGKMETLNHALEIGALSKMDHVQALRRLQSVTGDDPTNPDRKYTLPETMQWFSTVLEVFWPYLREHISELTESVCDKALAEVSPDIDLVDVDLGTHAPGFGPITTRYVNGMKGEKDGGLEFGLGITYQAQVHVLFRVKNEEATIKSIKCVGTMYFWLRPLLDDVPFVGGIQAAFVNPPTLKFAFEGAQSMGMKKAQQAVRISLEQALAASCVVPNFFTLPFTKQVDITRFRSPRPQGILSLRIVKGSNLMAADEGFNPTSDPYVVVKVGAQEWRTKTHNATLDPVFDEVHKFMVYSPEQWVMLDVYDEDPGLVHDHIGRVVNLPINRLVLRGRGEKGECLPIEIPLTSKDGNPVQGEEGDISTLTVEAKWLTIDPMQETTDLGALVSVEVMHVTGLPDGPFKGPYRVRVSVLNNGETGTHTTKLTTPSTTQPGNEGSLLRSFLEEVHTLKKAGKSNAEIVEEMAYPADLVEEALKNMDGSSGSPLGDLMRSTLDAGTANPAAEFRRRARIQLKEIAKDTSPYFLQMVHIHTQALEDVVRLELLDSSNEVVGSTRLQIKDSVLGDEVDIAGPFEIKVNGTRKKAWVHGNITVRSLVDGGIPEAWNPKAKKHKALGDEKKKKPNQAIIDQNAGGKLTTEKELALMECLKAGSLTWGDYDILIGKLRGESDRTSIAETLEWVNMFVSWVWPRIRNFLKKITETNLEAKLQEAVASIPGQSWTGLKINLVSVDLGAREPSLSTIEAVKVTQDIGEGVQITLNNMSFTSNIDVVLKVHLAGMESTVRIQDFEFMGTLVFTLAPMVAHMPFVAGLQMAFPNPPHIDIGIKVLGNKEIPGLRQLTVGVLNRSIASKCVLPNIIAVPLQDDVPALELGHPDPAGVLRLSVIKAEHLEAGDAAVRFVRSAGSDAYAHVRIGGTTWSTKQITSLDPQWTEQKDFVVMDRSQNVDIEVFDADIANDDSLGLILQKETVLGGGTDLVVRGIPVEALCRRAWSADDRNRTVVLPLQRKVKDEELSVDKDPYLGARVVFKGTIDGNITLDDGQTVNVGDVGVVEEVDKNTKPFHTFYCSFDHAERVALHAQDLEVTKPLLVEKIVPVIGEDGKESMIHLHPEWLSATNSGQVAAYLVTVKVVSITGLPELSERDLGGPFKVRVTPEDAGSSSEKWTSAVTKPATAPHADIKQVVEMLQRMLKNGEDHAAIAKALDLAEDDVAEGASLFPPGTEITASSGVELAEEKLITLQPTKEAAKHGAASFDFPVVNGRKEEANRSLLRQKLRVPFNKMLVFRNSSRMLEIAYDTVGDKEVITFDIETSPKALSWCSRAQKSIFARRVAREPHFSEVLHIVSSSAEIPTLRYELLTSKDAVLATTKVKPFPNEVNDDVIEFIIKKEASGGWGFGYGASEAYEYNCKMQGTYEVVALKTMN
eukprot:Sspe_Gene.3065::Locus_1013_Transcript_1_1_Confidence_1.000_Length_10154::g.3065::m.3065